MPRKKRVMPESWHKAQAARAKERKEREKKTGEKRKVRGKARDYKEQGISKSLKSGRREVTTDTYESASYAVSQMRKGDQSTISVGSKVVKVTCTGRGFYPGTRIAIDKDGNVHMVDNNNIKSAWLL